MNRLARFAEGIAKFCRETGKPGPCADPNSKRQQRLKRMASKSQDARVDSVEKWLQIGKHAPKPPKAESPFAWFDQFKSKPRKKK